jgi:hypothetical protein
MNDGEYNGLVRNRAKGLGHVFNHVPSYNHWPVDSWHHYWNNYDRQTGISQPAATYGDRRLVLAQSVTNLWKCLSMLRRVIVVQGLGH